MELCGKCHEPCLFVEGQTSCCHHNVLLIRANPFPVRPPGPETGPERAFRELEAKRRAHITRVGK